MIRSRQAEPYLFFGVDATTIIEVDGSQPGVNRRTFADRAHDYQKSVVEYDVFSAFCH